MFNSRVDVCLQLFGAQENFFDDATADKTRNQIYAELAEIVGPATGLEAAKIIDMVTVGEGNSGNKITGQLKFAIKYHRVRSVHVTPTVFLNSVESPDISSGWTAAQWNEKLSSLGI